ncbi:hypothetical protein TNCV_4776601 [Trichonephila clavipes]|nr:hypothetical protein TNCV_4776601 [Trichonephila clavipes]
MQRDCALPLEGVELRSPWSMKQASRACFSVLNILQRKRRGRHAVTPPSKASKDRQHLHYGAPESSRTIARRLAEKTYSIAAPITCAVNDNHPPTPPFGVMSRTTGLDSNGMELGRLQRRIEFQFEQG